MIVGLALLPLLGALPLSQELEALKRAKDPILYTLLGVATFQHENHRGFVRQPGEVGKEAFVVRPGDPAADLLVRNLGLLLVKVKAQPHEEPIGLEARHLLVESVAPPLISCDQPLVGAARRALRDTPRQQGVPYANLEGPLEVLLHRVPAGALVRIAIDVDGRKQDTCAGVALAN